MSLAYSLSAYPVGIVSDGMDRVGLLILGLLLLVLADIVLAFAGGIAALALGAILWGLHMGFTQGLLAALVADTSPRELRGTAFGVFNLSTGLALLAASVIAGTLWSTLGPRSTFLCGALLSLLTVGGLLLLRHRLRSARP
jgi:MFS family permease